MRTTGMDGEQAKAGRSGLGQRQRQESRRNSGRTLEQDRNGAAMMEAPE